MSPRATRILLSLAVTVFLVYIFGYWVAQTHNPTDVRLWTQALYVGIAATGLNILTGYNGQVSIGHGAFFGVGAYTSAILISDHGWGYLPTLPVADRKSVV